MKLKLSTDFRKLISRKNASKCERIVGSLLELNNIEFRIEKTFDDLPRKRFDFYLPKENILIEVHGEQHYTQSNIFGSLEDIQESDKIKKEYAKSNNIEYVEIPAKKSEIPSIRNSIKRTELKYLLDNIDEHIWKDYSILRENKTKLPSIETIDIFNNLRKGNEIMVNETIDNGTVSTDIVVNECYSEEEEDEYIRRLNEVNIPGKVKCLKSGKVFNDIQDACSYYNIEYSELKEGATYYKHEGKKVLVSKNYN